MLCEPDGEIGRVFFFAGNAKALAGLSSLLDPGSKYVVADLVGRDIEENASLTPLEISGFSRYACFLRFSRTITEDDRDRLDERVEIASEHDASAIFDGIASAFDPLTAHLPSAEEIEQAISVEDILVIKHGSALQGFAFFDTISDKVVCLRYLVVGEAFRGNGVASALLFQKFSEMPPRSRCYLWVDRNNPATNLYRKMGFVEDGLQDLIMRYERKE